MTTSAIVTSVLGHTSAIVIVAWIVARLVAHRHPALRHAIWLSALACVVASPFVTRAAPHAGWSVVGAPRSTTVLAPWLAMPAEMPLARTPAEVPVAVTKSTPSIDWQAWLIALWCTGVLVQLARLALGVVRVVAIRRRAVMVHEGLATSRDIASPIALGVIRPLIVVPEDLFARLSERELADVLAHERAHIVRRDAVVGFAQRLVGAAYWFHPLLHLLNRELSRAREEVCDNHVLASRERADYARSLLASVPEHGVPSSAPALALWWPRFRLSDRIAGLLDERRVIMTRLHPMAFLSVLFGTVFAFAAMAATSPPVAMEVIDLSGEWRGDAFGSVVVRGDVATYERGSWRFALTGRRSFSGFWKESDSYGGTLRFTVAKNGEQLAGSYEVDANADHDAGRVREFTLNLTSRLTPTTSEGRTDGRVSWTTDGRVSWTQVLNPAYASAQAKVLAAKKSIDLYHTKGYTENHPYMQRAQEELRSAQEELAGLEKFLVTEAHAETGLRDADLRLTSLQAIVQNLLAQDKSASAPALGELLRQAQARVGETPSEAQAKILETIGKAYAGTGDLDSALDALRQAYDASIKQHGADHWETLRLQKQLGVTMAQQGKLQEALALLARSADGSSRVLGTEHPETLDCLARLADVKRLLGQGAEALALIERVIGVQQRVLGAQHPDTILTLVQLAEAHEAMGDLAQAESLLRAAFVSAPTLLGEDHPTTRRCLTALVRLLGKLGKADEAAKYAQLLKRPV